MENNYQKEFLEKHPDLSIELGNRFFCEAGTNKYRAKWKGNWTAKQLIDFADKGWGNYGGRIENLQELKDGTKTGTICVYFD